MSLSLHHGAITLGADPIDVVVGIETGRIHLDSNGNEIGDWSRDECQIVPDPSGHYLIVAENEELPFTPDDPVMFADALMEPSPPTTAADPQSEPTRSIVDELAPKPLTVIGFYLLAGITSALGLWAVWSLIV